MPLILEGITDPFVAFDRWYAEAVEHEPDVPNAMQLATLGEDGRPRVRTVLLKAHGPEGFVFYTNLKSRKGTDLGANPHVGLVFHWKSLQRQVHAYGTASLVSDAEADAYFATRDRGSQLGAWASRQSAPLPEVEARFAGKEVPRPGHWSGYRIRCDEVEFWQGRPSRLHDRVRFTHRAGVWARDTLFP